MGRITDATYTGYEPNCKFTNDMPEIMIGMFRQGCSITEIVAKLGISRQCFYRWIDPEDYRFLPEMRIAYEEGILLYEAWWEQQGRTSLREKEFNHVLWYMNMKNRFSWKDKQEVEQDGKVQVNIRHVDDENEGD